MGPIFALRQKKRVFLATFFCKEQLVRFCNIARAYLVSFLGRKSFVMGFFFVKPTSDSIR